MAYHSLFLQNVNTYLPLVLSLLLMVIALALTFIFKDKKTASIEKIVHNYLYLDAELQTTIEALSNATTSEVCSVFLHENSKIDPSSKTHKILANLFFDDLVFSKTKETFFETPNKFIEPLKELLLSFKDPKSKIFLETILDKKDIEDLDKLGIITLLIDLFPEVGWQNIVQFHSKASDFSLIKDSYFSLINSALDKVTFLENVKPENICFRNEDYLFFRNLVFEDDDVIAKNALLICCCFNFDDIETTIEDRLNLTRNNSYIENSCLKALLKVHSKKSCKVIYHYIISNKNNNSSSMLQLAFQTLNEMGVVGKPYIVLLTRSEEPFISVMAKSYLHSDSL